LTPIGVIDAAATAAERSCLLWWLQPARASPVAASTAIPAAGRQAVEFGAGRREAVLKIVGNAILGPVMMAARSPPESASIACPPRAARWRGEPVEALREWRLWP
jgi:hypothetical protein